MAGPEKRCHYEILGVSKESSADEIRSAFRRLALQRHPDKLVKSGSLSEAEATAQFQEILHAYEVLSDPKERAWYDSHRSQILFADHSSAGGGASRSSGIPNSVPNLFSFFSNTVYSGYSDTGKGFYKVYSDLFNQIYQNEINFARKLGLGLDAVREAPIMGNLGSPYTQVTAFYNYWLGFSTVMDFCWVDQYDVMAGINRKSRRLMEEDNKKLRKKAKREYNETVRGLAEFVKKRDKRVIDMNMKRNAEMEKKKEEEREKRKKMEKERMERLRNYQEPEWAKIQEEEEEEEENEGKNWFEDDSDKKKDEGKELYCVVCSKKFKSEKQWKNHEQSKKHKEKVAELIESFSDEEDERGGNEEEEIVGLQDSSEKVDEVDERFKEGLKIEEEGGEEEDSHFVDAEEGENEADVIEEEEEDDDGDVDVEDDEMSILNSMVSGHSNRKKNSSSRGEAELLKTEVRGDTESDKAEYNEYDKRKSRRRRNQNGWKERDKENDHSHMEKSSLEAFLGNVSNDKAEETEVARAEVRVENENDEDKEFMEYDNRKRTGRNKKGRRERGKTNGHVTKKNLEGDDKRNTVRHVEESTSDGFVGNELIEKASEQNEKASYRSHDSSTKSKKSSRGKKDKAVAAKNSGNMCDKCGEEFESRNRLHKHLADTGHGTLKPR